MKNRSFILLFFIAAKFLIQFFAIHPVYELQRDEYLHLDLGRHLAFGYTSVPPFIGWTSYLIGLLGNTEFWVKFYPALFGALLILVVWKTVEELGGRLFALCLASTAVLFSIFIRLNTLYQPNSFDALCWSLVLFFGIKYVNTHRYKWLYYVAVSFAIGLLNKYNIGFLLLGIIPALLLTEKRNVFLNRHLFLSAGLSFLIILPNLVWQINNGFPVISHLRTLSDTQLVNISRIGFLTDQLYFFMGSVFVILFGLISFFTYKKFQDHRWLFLTFVFTIGIFVVLKAKNYYAVGLYPVFIAFGAVYLESLLSKGWLKFLRVPAILIPLAVFIISFPLILPVLPPSEIVSQKELFDKLELTRWEDGKLHELPQDYADMLGWKELAGIIDSALVKMDEKDRTLIHCDNYGQAGAINFYSEELVEPAVSMNADYINWYPLEKFEIKNVILVKDIYDNDKDRNKERPLFEEVSLIGEIKNKYARESGTKVYLLKGAKRSVNDIFKNEILKRKDDRLNQIK